MRKQILSALIAAVLLLTPALAMARQQVIPDSATRQLTEEELREWDYESLNVILNEIFARYGYVFEAGDRFDQYFSSLNWYVKNANADNEAMVMDKLTPLEWDNEQLVKAVMADMKATGNLNTEGRNYRDYINFSESPSTVALDFYYNRFKEGQKLDVYSAPSAASYRGANGRARVSTNEPVYVAGWEGGWLLVMYDTNDGAVRAGYVRGGDFTSDYPIANLEFAYKTVTCARSVSMTDDPVLGSTAIVRIPEGQQITYLATHFNKAGWAYVEAEIGGQTVRGFVPLDAVR